MNSLQSKDPIIKFLQHSDDDNLLTQVYETIRKWRICWLAIEHLEYTFGGNKIHENLWFHSRNNTIEFFNSNSNKILAVIHFDAQLLL